MSALTEAVVETGLLPKDHLDELKRWGFLQDLNVSDDVLISKAKIEAVIATLQKAIESEDTVSMRDTDLDIIHNYLLKKKNGKLCFSGRAGAGSFSVEYSVTELGEIVIPWTHEDTDLFDLVMDPETFLKPARGSGMRKTFFSDARELFFGSKKAFIVCVPAKSVK